MITPSDIADQYRAACQRLIVLDYDGTLSQHTADLRLEASHPTPDLIDSLTRLATDPDTTLMVLSGRPHTVLEDWFGHLPIALGGEHGAWLRQDQGWQVQYDLSPEWKDRFRPTIDGITRRTPGAHFNEKLFSFVWHYRAVEPELAEQQRTALTAELEDLAQGTDIVVYQGAKLIEVMPRSIGKGVTVRQLVDRAAYDFILIIGDDFNDEAMFEAAPPHAITIKVGEGPTAARHHIGSVTEVKALLGGLTMLK